MPFTEDRTQVETLMWMWMFQPREARSRHPYHTLVPNEGVFLMALEKGMPVVDRPSVQIQVMDEHIMLCVLRRDLTRLQVSVHRSNI